VATVAQDRLRGCDGFRVESEEGLLGWIEETWIGPAREPTALAVRTIDGRRGLLVAGAVAAAVPERKLIVVGHDQRLLELDVPQVDIASVDGVAVISASWTTTGEMLEPPPPPGHLQCALLALRPWRLAPPPTPEEERPLWQLMALLYAALALVVALVIAFAILAAHLAAGSAA
jgi:hypothetical protein